MVGLPLGYIKTMDLKPYATVPGMRNMQRFNDQKLETVLVPMAHVWAYPNRLRLTASPRPLRFTPHGSRLKIVLVIPPPNRLESTAIPPSPLCN